jgi:hypothetical protein
LVKCCEPVPVTLAGLWSPCTHPDLVGELGAIHSEP